MWRTSPQTAGPVAPNSAPKLFCFTFSCCPLLPRLQSSDLVLQQASPPTQAMTCVCALWKRLRPAWQQLHSSAAFTPMKTAVTEREDNKKDFKALCSQSIKISNWDSRHFHCCYNIFCYTHQHRCVQYFFTKLHCWFNFMIMPPFYSFLRVMLHPPSPPVACMIGLWQTQAHSQPKRSHCPTPEAAVKNELCSLTTSSWSVEPVVCHSEGSSLCGCEGWAPGPHAARRGAMCSYREASGK